MKRYQLLILIAALLFAGWYGWRTVDAHLQEQYELSLDIAEGAQE